MVYYNAFVLSQLQYKYASSSILIVLCLKNKLYYCFSCPTKQRTRMYAITSLAGEPVTPAVRHFKRSFPTQWSELTNCCRRRHAWCSVVTLNGGLEISNRNWRISRNYAVSLFSPRVYRKKRWDSLLASQWHREGKIVVGCDENPKLRPEHVAGAMEERTRVFKTLQVRRLQNWLQQ